MRLPEKKYIYIILGSGWIIDRLIYIDVMIASYNPLRASGHFHLPKNIKNTRAVLNIINTDDADWY